MKIDGQCHCGRISYEGEVDPEQIAICHCTDCQTLSGTVFRTVAPIPENRISITGEPKIYIKTGASGAKREQAFCPECGAPIYASGVGDGPKIYNIRIGTANQRDKLMPGVQIWQRSAVGWLAGLQDIPKTDEQ